MSEKTAFHEGQEVEVRMPFTGKLHPTVGSVEVWRKAKIVAWPRREADRWKVQFPDGARAVFDAEHIREDPLETAARYLNQGGTIEGDR
jgi:hypothetical protein